MNPVLRLLGPNRDFEATVETINLGDSSFHDLAQHFARRHDFALLDSRTQEGDLGRYSFLAFEPFMKVGSIGSKSWVEVNGSRHYCAADVLTTLQMVLDNYNVSPAQDRQVTPLLAGGIGYFAYEFGRQLERLPANAVNDLNIPDCYFCFYNNVITKDWRSGDIFLSHFNPNPRIRSLPREAMLEQLESVAAWRKGSNCKMTFPWNDCPAIVQEMPRRQYLRSIERIKEYILAGDVYQVNFTQRFRVDAGAIDPWSLYQRLMAINPSPFASYLNFDDVTIISASPERFVRQNQRQVETRPIKGTVKRGSTVEEDEQLRAWLLGSEKNRAELAMIVDLMRNDIGKVCVPGSVKVASFPILETYSSVHHLVGSITGTLETEKSAIDLIRASFPGGSITGAPKIRAMEIIDELEPVVRGVYTGTIGYLGFNDTADLNIVIRTIQIANGNAYIQAGGGIVADSSASEEYDESLLKAQRLFEALKSSPVPERADRFASNLSSHQ